MPILAPSRRHVRKSGSCAFLCHFRQMFSLPLIGLLLMLFAGAALAQDGQPEQEAAPAAATGGDAAIDARRVEDLIAALEDPTERQALLERLRLLVQAREEDASGASRDSLAGGILSLASEGGARLSQQLQVSVDYLQQAPRALTDVYAAFTEPDMHRVMTEVVGGAMVIFLLASLASWLTRRTLRRGRGALASRQPPSPPARVVLLIGGLVLNLVPLAVFLAVAYLTLPMVDPRPITRVVLLALVNAHVLAQGLVLAAAAVLVVETPSQRPYALENRTAAYAYLWFRRLVIVTVYGYFICEALRLLGMPAAPHQVLVNLTGLFVALLLVFLILQNRKPVADAIRGDGTATPVMAQVRSTVAHLWHLLAMAYVAGVYIVWAFSIEGGFGYLVRASLITLIVLIALRLAMAGVEHGLNRLFHVPPHLHEQYPMLEARANRYRPLLGKILKALLLVVGLLIILEGWGLDALGLVATDAGHVLLARVTRIALILGFSLLVWEVVSAIVERKLRENAGNNRRVDTLLPLFKNVMRIIIMVVVGMITLSEVGVDIGPLLASAGVIGLAVGFGAQALVKDVITGSFVIMEDIIGVGDWVDLGNHAGMVEAMTIRTLRLRDLSGNVRIIPFGEISAVHKVASDYSYALIVVGVAYRENTDHVVTLLQQVGEALRADPEWGPKILEPMEVQGINELGTSSVDIRVRLKCKPLQQWGLRREFLRRTKLLFDEQGVEIPFPHQTVYFGEDRDGKAPPVRVAMAGDGGTDL